MLATNHAPDGAQLHRDVGSDAFHHHGEVAPAVEFLDAIYGAESAWTQEIEAHDARARTRRRGAMLAFASTLLLIGVVFAGYRSASAPVTERPRLLIGPRSAPVAAFPFASAQVADRADIERAASIIPGWSTEVPESVGPQVPEERQTQTPAAGAVPVQLIVDSIGLDFPIGSVGLASDGSMEIPGDILEVGWYKFGPHPGQRGSSVLAAHVDGYPRKAGAFYNLRQVPIGSSIVVVFDDGSVLDFVAEGGKLYEKEDLPVDDLFSLEGPPRLALITCGGVFDRAAGSYEHNYVLFARPADQWAPQAGL